MNLKETKTPKDNIDSNIEEDQESQLAGASTADYRDVKTIKTE